MGCEAARTAGLDAFVVSAFAILAGSRTGSCPSLFLYVRVRVNVCECYAALANGSGTRKHIIKE